MRAGIVSIDDLSGSRLADLPVYERLRIDALEVMLIGVMLDETIVLAILDRIAGFDHAALVYPYLVLLDR